jgi:hypothetical protein
VKQLTEKRCILKTSAQSSEVIVLNKTIETRNVIPCEQKHPSEERDLQYGSKKDQAKRLNLAKYIN